MKKVGVLAGASDKTDRNNRPVRLVKIVQTPSTRTLAVWRITMITYDLTDTGKSLYQSLYHHIREDISSGKLEPGEKLPSKRALARNLGISTITVENAYDQLMGEGYLYAVPRKGYFVAELSGIRKVGVPVPVSLHIQKSEKKKEFAFDFSSGQTERTNFPFSVWAKLMRETISQKEKELLTVSPCEGVGELREAIAGHLSSFRGMVVDPDQIIVGAGTEYLYGLLIKLLGAEKIYCIENPGYKKLKQIYESHHVTCRFAAMDESGIVVEELRKNHSQIVHISPNHHFPTGITMPVSRRYELLAWANEEEGRYILEDDYDSEFRLNGRPVPSLQSIDACEKVIYMNTFSKSLTSTIRISYMVLPVHLANRFYQTLSFYSNTVSTFEQYTLAAFISQGYFEKHINRMRLHYGRKRAKILEMIRMYFTQEECRILENDSGLHFILQFQTKLTDAEVKERLLNADIKIRAITDYDMDEQVSDQHRFLLNYSNMDVGGLKAALSEVRKILDRELPQSG